MNTLTKIIGKIFLVSTLTPISIALTEIETQGLTQVRLSPFNYSLIGEQRRLGDWGSTSYSRFNNPFVDRTNINVFSPSPPPPVTPINLCCLPELDISNHAEIIIAQVTQPTPANPNKLVFPWLPEFGRVFRSQLIPQLANEFGVFSPIANHYLQQVFSLGYDLIESEVNQVLGKAGLPSLKELEQIWDLIPIEELAPIVTAIYDSSNDSTGTIARQFANNNAIANLGNAIADQTVLSKEAQEKNNQIIAQALENLENSLKITTDADKKKITQEIVQDLLLVTANAQVFDLINLKQNEDIKKLLAGNTRNLSALLAEIQRDRARQLKEDNATNKLAARQTQLVLPLLILEHEKEHERLSSK